MSEMRKAGDALRGEAAGQEARDLDIRSRDDDVAWHEAADSSDGSAEEGSRSRNCRASAKVGLAGSSPLEETAAGCAAEEGPTAGCAGADFESEADSLDRRLSSPRRRDDVPASGEERAAAARGASAVARREEAA